jgi:hypothetical protein
MRALVISFLLVGLVPAVAQQSNVKLDPLASPNAERSAESETLLKLQEIQKRLKQLGFKQVEVVPQAVLIRAIGGDDKPVMMIVDTDAMVAIQLTAPPQDETTGSGASDEGKYRR